jgi:hypothetical protein
MFFLCYHGKGYTDAGVWAMPLDFFMWNVHRLSKQLQDENQAREKALNASRSR